MKLLLTIFLLLFPLFHASPIHSPLFQRLWQQNHHFRDLADDHKKDYLGFLEEARFGNYSVLFDLTGRVLFDAFRLVMDESIFPGRANETVFRDWLNSERLINDTAALYSLIFANRDEADGQDDRRLVSSHI